MKKETARSFLIHFNQQKDMTVTEWKDLVYELFRINMTWKCFYQITVEENRSGVVARAIVRKPYEQNFKEWLCDNEIAFTDDKMTVGVFDWEEDYDIECVYMD